MFSTRKPLLFNIVRILTMVSSTIPARQEERLSVSQRRPKSGEGCSISRFADFWKALSISIFIPILLTVSTYTSVYPQPASVHDGFFENGESTRRGTDEGMFADTPTRTKIDLAGTWQYSRDGDMWLSVTVPSAYDFIGRVIFQRTFEVGSGLLQNSFFRLVVYGINYKCDILINGVPVGRHTGGYTSFVLKIPENLLKAGKENSIKIIVTNELNAKDTVPLRQPIWGWRSYGGIFRNIYLLATPTVWIDDLTMQTDLSTDFASATVGVTALIAATDVGSVLADNSNVGRRDRISLNCYAELYDRLTGKSVARSAVSAVEVLDHRTARAEVDLTVDRPSLWSLTSPSLYLLKIFVLHVGKLVDEYDTNVGFRSVTVQECRFLLNGQPFTLKGISLHEDHPKFGSATNYETMERDIVAIKNLGVNAVRFGHYPPHPYMLNLCDRYGLFVLEEIPVSAVPADILTDERYLEIAENYLREMITRDRYHPSVLAWGIGNEFDSAEPKARTYVSHMHDVVRSLDHRPVYYASRMIMNDTCADLVEIAAVNAYCDDINQLRTLLETWKKRHPRQPVLLTGYGKAVQPNNRSGYSDPLSIDTQTKYLVDHYRAIQQSEIAGSFIWTFSDWRGDRPVLGVGTDDQYLYTMGVVAYDRDRRLSYDAVRALYTGEKVPAVSLGDYSDKKPIFYIVYGLILLIVFAFSFNLFRRFRENVIRALVRTYNFYADVRDQRIFSYIQTTVVGIIVAATLALVMSNILYFFRGNSALDYVLAHLIIWDELKAVVDSLIWNPIAFTIYFTILFFIVLLVVASLLRLGVAFVQKRIYFSDAYLTTIWSSLPIVLLIPVGMVLYRIMQTESYIVPLLGMIIVILTWVLFRLLKGTSIMYDVRPGRVYGCGILLVLVLLAVMFVYYNATQSTLAYIKFAINIANSYR